ncbi:IPT/TIG domain-containing protein [Sphingobacterium sp. UT-1RO-CII-1]|uniref:IPT/TIG domain-containing protein n=1 Tax=Sphingobacterium sp. UT-1RO-CII-1 TaxID=2995225 RepID=UPI00227AE03B|nr:IPT/TIG domain-containing protein [Sphingobacterium sp. UT-1RO-CII-1]MCY4778082.1 IPT/TIG domain-containing protein [Sphingobacterium sp. UT-1RO-CII-1]
MSKPIVIIFYFVLFIFLSCSKKEHDDVLYDPTQPVTLESFYPDSGGFATRMIINGTNFGTDTSLINVFFNEKKASVVGTNGSQLYVVVPKLPGDTCEIKVLVDGKQQVFDNTFKYFSSYSITTVAGKQGSSVTSMVEGSLAETEFSGYLSFLAIDGEGNIFGTQREDNILFMINETRNLSKKLFVSSIGGPPNMPTINPLNQRIYVPTDSGPYYWESDPELQWTTKVLQILHPNDAEKDYTPIDWKHSLAFNAKDKLVYTRSWRGDFIRFDPKTRVGELLASTTSEQVFPEPLFGNMDAYHVFDPNDDDILYIIYQPRHCIYTLNIRTLEHKLFAGTNGVAGYNDGEAKNAEFKNPRQLTVDKEGNVYVADSGNHCIRKISNGMVTTVVGRGGQAGYVDGSAEDALLNDPWGVAVDENDDVYVADRGNRIIRKLSFQ